MARLFRERCVRVQPSEVALALFEFHGAILVVVDDAVGALELRTAISSSMILGTVSASERMAPVQGLQPRERRRQ